MRAPSARRGHDRPEHLHAGPRVAHDRGVIGDVAFIERIAVSEDASLGGFRLQDAQRFGVLGKRVLALECGGRDRNERAEHDGCCDGDAELCHLSPPPWWSREPILGSNSWFQFLVPIPGSNSWFQLLALLSLRRDRQEKVQTPSRSTGKAGKTFFSCGRNILFIRSLRPGEAGWLLRLAGDTNNGNNQTRRVAC